MICTSSSGPAEDSVGSLTEKDWPRAVTCITHLHGTINHHERGLSTRLPPLDDVRVRRAVNFAVDRARMVELFPFPGSRMTCQILPPGFTGYRPYCPYTVDPNPAGTWTAPDLARARELVRASGTAGTEVTVWEGPAFVEIGRYFVSVLEDFGYPARLHVFDDPAEFFAFVLDSRNEVQTAGMSWLNDKRTSPNEFIGLLSCKAFVPERPDKNQNPAHFCYPGIDEVRGVLVLVRSLGDECLTAQQPDELVGRRALVVQPAHPGRLYLVPGVQDEGEELRGVVEDVQPGGIAEVLQHRDEVPADLDERGALPDGDLRPRRPGSADQFPSPGEVGCGPRPGRIGIHRVWTVRSVPGEAGREDLAGHPGPREGEQLDHPRSVHGEVHGPPHPDVVQRWQPRAKPTFMVVDGSVEMGDADDSGPSLSRSDCLRNHQRGRSCTYKSYH